jgi:hypothetical protein
VGATFSECHGAAAIRAPVARSFHMTGNPLPLISDEYQNKGVTGIDRPMNIILKDLVSRCLPGVEERMPQSELAKPGIGLRAANDASRVLRRALFLASAGGA